VHGDPNSAQDALLEMGQLRRRMTVFIFYFPEIHACTAAGAKSHVSELHGGSSSSRLERESELGLRCVPAPGQTGCCSSWLCCLPMQGTCGRSADGVPWTFNALPSSVRPGKNRSKARAEERQLETVNVRRVCCCLTTLIARQSEI
jgi:hypothetical protein